jgi:opacity protein-like surface antigen
MALAKILRASAAAAGMLACVGVAQSDAADIYTGGSTKDVIPPPINPWAGFYIGGNLGIDWANQKTNQNEYWHYYGGNYYDWGSFGGDKLNTTGGFGGGQIGYNWQSSSFVFGVELDLGGLAGDNNKTWIIPGYGGRSAAVGLKESGGFYGDITGRLGYAWGPTLIYAKGGFAWLDTKLNAWEWDGANTWNGNNNNNTISGWTVGAGLEWLVSPNWSIKVEYLHFDFSLDHNYCCGDYANQYGGYNNFNMNNKDLEVDTVKLGFNYFFHPTYTPLK